MLQVNNVSLQYGSKKLFEDVNLKFTKCNCYGIMERTERANQLF